MALRRTATRTRQMARARTRGGPAPRARREALAPRACSATAAKALADLIRYVIDNGGDAAEPNSRATPEALATRIALVDEFERLSAAVRRRRQGRRRGPQGQAQVQRQGRGRPRPRQRARTLPRSPSRCATAPRRSRSSSPTSAPTRRGERLEANKANAAQAHQMFLDDEYKQGFCVGRRNSQRQWPGAGGTRRTDHRWRAVLP